MALTNLINTNITRGSKRAAANAWAAVANAWSSSSAGSIDGPIKRSEFAGLSRNQRLDHLGNPSANWVPGRVFPVSSQIRSFPSGQPLKTTDNFEEVVVDRSRFGGNFNSVSSSFDPLNIKGVEPIAAQSSDLNLNLGSRSGQEPNGQPDESSEILAAAPNLIFPSRETEYIIGLGAKPVTAAKVSETAYSDPFSANNYGLLRA